ncbi:hypothetical protein EUTSA_v10029352mg, partial [Eutrema salsugineum]
SPLSVARDKPRSCSIYCSKLRTQEYITSQETQHELPLIQWQQLQGEDAPQISVASNNAAIEEAVKRVKSILRNISDGEITISAYDTAWVALIDAGNKTPAFPSAVKWIADNQLSDGSWGDAQLFSYHDRLINTLACVVALRSWNLFPHQCHKGIRFFRENIGKLKEEDDEHMPIGFEVAFPSLLEIAREINIDVPYDSPVLKDIYAKKELKLTRIPKEIMHKIPTTLLHSLEGMRDLDWEKLLKLQCKDGSFLFSPSSTAFAFMQTRDNNCLRYLRNTVKRFNGGVPNVFPVDLFEHIWIVDRLQRLGISRYFEEEINECLDYVHRYWTDKGICWARCSHVQDIDDTAMAFRLLRLHGYQVSANFEKEGEFFCFAGQSNQAVTGMFNLYRASQLAFSREKILKNAKEFSSKYLQHKQERDELLDKWIIMKDLPGEIGFALEIPWYASLPRVETRFYIEQYGGENDVWIGKTLYRMPYVNNNEYLELAKQDYNNCQALHQLEWDTFQKWYEENRLNECGVSRSELLECYYLAAATIFEEERSQERMVWAKSSVMVKAIFSCFGESIDSRKSFFDQFHKYIANARRSDHHFNDRSMRLDRPGSVQASRLVGILVGTLNQMSFDLFMSHGRDVNKLLYQSWEDWLEKWKLDGDEGEEGELMVKMIILMKNNDLTNFFSHPHFVRLSEIINRVYLIAQYLKAKRNDEKEKTIRRMDNEMEQMVELVVLSETDTFRDVSITFLDVAKAFYYSASCGDHLQTHITKVLFQKVL